MTRRIRAWLRRADAAFTRFYVDRIAIPYGAIRLVMDDLRNELRHPEKQNAPADSVMAGNPPAVAVSSENGDNDHD